MANFRHQQYSDPYYWMNGEGASVQQGDGNEVIPPGEDDRNYRRENDRMKDHRDRDRNYDRDRDRERKRRSRSRSRSHERRRRRDKKKRDRSSGSGSSRSRSRSRDHRRRSRSRSRDHNRRERDKSGYDFEYREREYERNDSWKMIAPNNTIMVNSLPLHVTENEIRSDILVYGLVPKDIRLIRRKDTGRKLTHHGVAYSHMSRTSYFDTISAKETEKNEETTKWMTKAFVG